MSYIIYMTRLFNETILGLHTVYCDSSLSLSRSTTKTLDEFPEAFDKLTVGTNGQRYGAHGSAASRTRTEHVTTHMPPPRGPKSDAQCNWCVGSGTATRLSHATENKQRLHDRRDNFFYLRAANRIPVSSRARPKTYGNLNIPSDVDRCCT